MIACVNHFLSFERKNRRERRERAALSGLCVYGGTLNLKLNKTETVKQLFIDLRMFTIHSFNYIHSLHKLQCIMHVKTNESQILCHAHTIQEMNKIWFYLNII